MCSDGTLRLGLAQSHCGGTPEAARQTKFTHTTVARRGRKSIVEPACIEDSSRRSLPGRAPALPQMLHPGGLRVAKDAKQLPANISTSITSVITADQAQAAALFLAAEASKAQKLSLIHI